jgi:hypothetical protein
MYACRFVTLNGHTRVKCHHCLARPGLISCSSLQTSTLVEMLEKHRGLPGSRNRPCCECLSTYFWPSCYFCFALLYGNTTILVYNLTRTNINKISKLVVFWCHMFLLLQYQIIRQLQLLLVHAWAHFCVAPLRVVALGQ